MLWIMTPVPDSAIQRFYRRQARIYDATRWIMLHGRRTAVARLALQPGNSVLEVGCGTGLNFRHVLSYLDPARGRLTGLDFSEPMLERAKRRAARNGWKNVTLVHGDATARKFPEPFDAVLFAYSLSMIPDWRAAVQNARAHLNPAGRLVVLDFGPFTGWGPLGPAMRAWMGWYGVLTTRPYEAGLREMFGKVEVDRLGGNYCFIAVAANM